MEEKENTDLSDTKNSFKRNYKKIIIILVLLLICLMARSCIKEFFKGFIDGFNEGYHEAYSASQLSEEEKQKLKDASFVYGFLYGNTRSVEDFCKDTGYVPYEYIKSFKITFDKTYQNADELIRKHFSEAGIKELQKTIAPSGLNRIEEDFLSFQKSFPNMNKEDYCKLYDDEKENIIPAQVQLLKQKKPHMLFAF